MQNKILGVKIINGKEAGEFAYFDKRDIYFIDLWSPKKNYRVPRFYTKDGVFTVLLTLETCEKAFDHLISLDSGNLVNLEQISHVTKTPFALTAYFADGSSTSVAKYKEDLIKHLIKKP